MVMNKKILIYQVLPRLYGNRTDGCQKNGSIAQNGCGKMNDFTKEVLARIKSDGYTHIWYTGLLEHATQTDYSAYGIHPDHPAVVKGKAGSPYAIKDYYDVDPDLAVDVTRRMQEFTQLVKRTHDAGLGFVMDFVPNHVARQYHSDVKPRKVRDLGEDDDTSCSFSAQNNFYYIPGQPLRTSFDQLHVAPSPYKEYPAKATGNNRFDAFPEVNDWYETVKLNYGVDYCGGSGTHFDPTPNTWLKMRDILLFWAGKGIDAFRCDMAEMVPVEFWGWVIPQIKERHPKLIFIAEVYNPNEYRNYIAQGHFDYLYDKVGLYDTLRGVVCRCQSASAITGCWQQVDDIKGHMLNFLENHDEQRIASDFFAGNGRPAIPALIVSACMGSNPFMVYAGQEFGERGMDEEGFSGKDGRTTIFDYWSVPSIKRYLEGNLTPEEQKLHEYYHTILTLCQREAALREGVFFDLMYANYGREQGFNPDRQYAFLRQKENELILVVANFDDTPCHVGVFLPQHAFDFLHLKPGKRHAIDLLSGENATIDLLPDQAVHVSLPALGATMLKVKF